MEKIEKSKETLKSLEEQVMRSIFERSFVSDTTSISSFERVAFNLGSVEEKNENFGAESEKTYYDVGTWSLHVAKWNLHVATWIDLWECTHFHVVPSTPLMLRHQNHLGHHSLPCRDIKFP